MRKAGIRALIVCIAAALLLLTGGCGRTEPTPGAASVPETRPSAPARRLKITADTDPHADSQHFSSDELGGRFSYGLTYKTVENVRIELDGEILPLEEAIRGGAISEGENFDQARTDAENGFCEESWESEHGLSNFTYVYPECSVRLIYDVLEAPDGRQHLISYMAVYSPEIILGPYFNFRDADRESLCREDWGLSLEVADASATGAVISCAQSGGQQIGELKVVGYYIAILDEKGGYVDSYDPVWVEQPLEMGGTTELTLDWEGSLGALPPGKYKAQLEIYDIFDKSQVHPLMEDFFSRQIFETDFTVAE